MIERGDSPIERLELVVPDRSLGLTHSVPRPDVGAMPFAQQLLALQNRTIQVVTTAALIGASIFVVPGMAMAQSDDCAVPTEVAAQMTNNELRLQRAVCNLIETRFGGDASAAFRHYAGADGAVNASELSAMLVEAGVGNIFTRGAWVDGVITYFDEGPGGNGNGKVDRVEFARVAG